MRDGRSGWSLLIADVARLAALRLKLARLQWRACATFSAAPSEVESSLAQC